MKLIVEFKTDKYKQDQQGVNKMDCDVEDECGLSHCGFEEDAEECLHRKLLKELEENKMKPVMAQTIKGLRARIADNQQTIKEMESEIERLKQDTKDTHNFLANIQANEKIEK